MLGVAGENQVSKGRAKGEGTDRQPATPSRQLCHRDGDRSGDAAVHCEVMTLVADDETGASRS